MTAMPAAPATDRRHWIAVSLIGLLIAVGFFFYVRQVNEGVGITGLGRDVAWGLYIAQFAFAEGLAAAAVIVLLPPFLHGAGEFERIALFGVLIAIAAVVMCLLFIVVDLGQPARVFNVLLHPTPWSMMFWDMVCLGGYLVLNSVIALALLEMRRTRLPAPAWLRPVVLLSLPWGLAVHTVSAFLFSGMASRPLWHTTVLAPRFLASAFATSAALLLLVCLALRHLARFDAGEVVVRRLGVIMSYALVCSLFLMLPELFTAFYAGVPDHLAPHEFLFVGLDGRAPLVPFTWLSLLLLLAAAVVVLMPKLGRRESLLIAAAVAVLAGIWLDKGLVFVIAGFAPTPLGAAPAYLPTMAEWAIAGGIWGIGALIVAVSYRVALKVWEEVRN